MNEMEQGRTPQQQLNTNFEQNVKNYAICQFLHLSCLRATCNIATGLQTWQIIYVDVANQEHYHLQQESQQKELNSRRYKATNFPKTISSQGLSENFCT